MSATLESRLDLWLNVTDKIGRVYDADGRISVFPSNAGWSVDCDKRALQITVSAAHQLLQTNLSQASFSEEDCEKYSLIVANMIQRRLK